VFGGMLRKFTIGGALAIGLAVAAPLAAQTYSDGYKFLQAVEKKDVTKVNELLSEPGNTVINSRDLSSGRSALHIVVERRDRTWLSFLLGRGANPNIADIHRVTPLIRASQIGFIEGVQELVSHGAKVDDPNDTGETPLILAVHRRDAPLMRVLLAAGADPNRSDNAGRSARDYAEEDGRNSPLMAEITRSEAQGNRRSSDAGTYGPS